MGVACWEGDFLFDRHQQVKLSSDCFSEWGSVPSGVPQGTELGPWLFILMINDLQMITIVFVVIIIIIFFLWLLLSSTLLILLLSLFCCCYNILHHYLDQLLSSCSHFPLIFHFTNKSLACITHGLGAGNVQHFRLDHKKIYILPMDFLLHKQITNMISTRLEKFC